MLCGAGCSLPGISVLYLWQKLVQQIAERIGRILEKRGLIERDMENAWLAADGSGGALDDLIGHSITYRIAVGPRAGQKLFTLQTLLAGAIPEAERQGDHRGAAQAVGSRCTPASTLSLVSVRSLSGCAAT